MCPTSCSYYKSQRFACNHGHAVLELLKKLINSCGCVGTHGKHKLWFQLQYHTAACRLSVLLHRYAYAHHTSVRVSYQTSMMMSMKVKRLQLARVLSFPLGQLQLLVTCCYATTSHQAFAQHEFCMDRPRLCDERTDHHSSAYTCALVAIQTCGALCLPFLFSWLVDLEIFCCVSVYGRLAYVHTPSARNHKAPEKHVNLGASCCSIVQTTMKIWTYVSSSQYEFSVSAT